MNNVMNIDNASATSLKLMVHHELNYETPKSKLTKKAYSCIPLDVFCLNVLRIHHNYFFRRGFENVPA